MNNSLTDDFFIERAISIVENTRQMGGVIRIIGGLAILTHSMEHRDLFKRLNRLGNENKGITDIDLIAYKSSLGIIDDVMRRMNYINDCRVLMFYGDSRRIYYANDRSHQVDVFVERLNYNHPIEFKTNEGTRLEIDYPTISPADLLLEKLQIHYIAEKDIKDIILLLRAHILADNDIDAVNLKRLEEVLGKDWGFWYDAKINLEKNFCKKY